MRRYRHQLGISQETAARRLEVAHNTWGRWERGEAYPPIPGLKRIAELLQTTASRLLEEPADS